MDEQGFNNALERLKRVNEVVETLDPAVRASAFELLAPYIAEPEPDIASLAFIVLMDAANAAQEIGRAHV